MIERLEFQVQPGNEDRFLSEDEKVWGAWLRRQKGFMSRQVIHYGAGRLAILNFWKDKESIDKASKSKEIKIMDAMLKAKLGNVFRMTSSKVM